MRQLAKDLVITYAGAATGALAGALVASLLFNRIATGAREDDVFGWVQWGVVVGASAGAGIVLRAFGRPRALAITVVTALFLTLVVLIASKAQTIGMLIPLAPAAGSWSAASWTTNE